MIGIMLKKIRILAFGPIIHTFFPKQTNNSPNAGQICMSNASNTFKSQRDQKANPLLFVNTSTLIYSQNTSFNKII